MDVRRGSWDALGGPKWFFGLTDRSGTCWGNTGEVRDGSGDHRGGLGRVAGPSERSGQVGGPSERSGMGRGTIGEVRDGSEDFWGGPEWVHGTLGEVQE